MSSRQRLRTFGVAIREVRTALGHSQAQLAGRVGRSQTFVSQVERGVATSLNVDDADRLCTALGATLVLNVESPRLLAGPRTRDAAHAACVGHVQRRLRSQGWHVRREVAIGTSQRPGWIDVLAWHPATGLLLVIEVKTELLDIGAVERQLHWYEREAPRAATRLGWRTKTVSSALVLLATGANDALVRQNARALVAAFPVRARQFAGVCDTGDASRQRGRAFAMIDPRSRARRWARSTILDGRRSPAPYANYADFVRRGRGRPRRGTSESG